MKDIPVHQLKDRVGAAGLDIKYFKPGMIEAERETMSAHRDDHYIFFLLEDGEPSLMIDFHEITFKSNSLFYVLPGQVHHRIKAEAAHGWYIAVDTMLIAPDYRNIFETRLLLQQPQLLDEYQLAQCKNILSLLTAKYEGDETSPFYIPVIHSLLQAFVGMVACCYSEVNGSGVLPTRPMQLSQQFKKLLSENIRGVKSPSAYAAKLHVSESYLNEALKKVTGFSVSYWIMQEVMMEAKRLLYYSELNVKQIAHNLGYEDHTYFSRLFKKITAMTPLEFRNQCHK